MSLPQPLVGRNSSPIQRNGLDKETLWKKTYLEAFQENYESVQRWTKWKEDHEQVKSALETLPDKLSHEVVIPFGSKALVKAKLVHTNEILTCIGSSYFVKQSAKQGIAMCARRINQSEEMLAKLENERTLLSNRQTVPKLEEAFPDDGTKEIIEEYNEEAEAEWRQKHREREAEYRRKLSELRKNQIEQPPLQTEEDVFRRLDELELEEELNDELERLRAECGHDYESSDEEDDGESSGEDEDEDGIEENRLQVLSSRPSFANGESDPVVGKIDAFDPQNKPVELCSSIFSEKVRVDNSTSMDKKRRISFVDEVETSLQKVDEMEERVNISIRFHHSEQSMEEDHCLHNDSQVIVPQEKAENPQYLTPADIYNVYKSKFSPYPKSILKKSSSYPDELEVKQMTKPVETSAPFGTRLGITFPESEDEDELFNKPERDLSNLPPVLCDVRESTSTMSHPSFQENTKRPVSRFKQARQARQARQEKH